MGEILVHLTKPGGEKLGPIPLEQVKRDLSAQRYRDTDFWAWYSGLPSWVPLYDLPGISGPPVVSAASIAQGVLEVRATGDTAVIAAPVAQGQPPAGEAPVPLHQQLSSGMPFSTLEQLFIFTTGNGPAVWKSETAAQMLRAIIGEEVATIRAQTSRDIISECDVSNLLGFEGSISESVWREMSARRPELVQRARAGRHRIVVRTFRIEDGSVVALMLFYDKQKV